MEWGGIQFGVSGKMNGVSGSCCCMTNYSKTKKLKPTTIIYLALESTV